MSIISLMAENISNISVRFVKGVGPKNCEYLKKLGVETVEDLFFYLPFRMEDRRHPVKASQILKMGNLNTPLFFEGVVRKIKIRRSPKRRTQFIEVEVFDSEGGAVTLVAFRQRVKFLARAVSVGSRLAVFGRAEPTAEGLVMYNFDFEVLEKGMPTLSFFRIVNFYRVTRGISLSRFRRWMWNAIKVYGERIPEFLPAKVLGKFSLPGRSAAVSGIHFPDDFPSAARAYRRIKFEEFFIFECAVALIRNILKKRRKPHRYILKRNLLTRWKKTLPFAFTAQQKKAINEIFDDMLAEKPMNRLLQGDVGSGKTVVALAAALLAAENGKQTVFLAPTLPLAMQHYETVKKLTEEINVEVEVLTGGVKKGQREKILSQIASGKCDIVIGTHALLEENVKFRDLTLVIIDEQQRFGVHQRALISQKGIIPDILVLTATPIPRTLALAVFGDLERTTIRQLPPGRKPVKTVFSTSEEAWRIIRGEVEKKLQAFIVYPLIEESDAGSGKAAEAAYKVLSKDVFPDFRVALLHGRMPSSRKQKIMEDMASRKIDILISTTVIEVGIDIPNATVMVIENAEKFGLSTLHQLRGRIGRGKAESCCIVTSSSTDEMAIRRLRYFTQCHDGFALAEKDLELRGAGEFFGIAQHGAMDVKFSYNRTLEAGFGEVSDLRVIKEACRAAFSLVGADPELKFYPAVRKKVYARFGGRLHLAKVS
ncbi:MAG: ATP-dependent DNA helicase RecG [Elusimicrobia bacterium]|nr:ATP-dependent DNA helicase RecG [Elusimicrobiota bacterium]